MFPKMSLARARHTKAGRKTSRKDNTVMKVALGTHAWAAEAPSSPPPPEEGRSGGRFGARRALVMSAPASPPRAARKVEG